jgi:hypothetical protein
MCICSFSAPIRCATYLCLIESLLTASLTVVMLAIGSFCSNLQGERLRPSYIFPGSIELSQFASSSQLASGAEAISQSAAPLTGRCKVAQLQNTISGDGGRTTCASLAVLRRRIRCWYLTARHWSKAFPMCCNRSLSMRHCRGHRHMMGLPWL